MSRLRRIYTLLQTAALSALTVTATTGSATDAQAQTSPSATAYAAALEEGTTEALVAFLNDFPGAPEADEAFRLLILSVRGARLVDSAIGDIDPLVVENLLQQINADQGVY
jgi:hypothetical protein